jgi:chloramphenicol 3-O-phosphotransferase
MNQCLVIIRGAPASGKSTIAKKLRDFQKKIVWLKVDNFKDFFSEDGTLGLEYANESAIVILDYLLGQGFSVIMEGIFQNTEYIAQAIKVAENRAIPYKVYQIKCSLSVLQKRDKERPGIKEGCRKPLGDEVIEKLYRIITDNPNPNAIILDTENLSPDECADTIEMAVKRFLT